MYSKTMKLIAEGIQKNRRALWDWHIQCAQIAPPPFYSSIDLRDSGNKIVPVDSNLFPAGFNNICPEDLRAAPASFRAQIESLSSQLKKESFNKILIIPESHTSNTYYIENLYYLHQLIENAGYEVQIGWYGSLSMEGKNEVSDSIQLTSFTGKILHAHPIQVRDGVLSTRDFTPDVVVLNNDFSSGYPKPFDQVKQPLVPSHTLGWHTRKKSEHFKYYNELALQFANIIGIDPWLIQIDTQEVGPVNFNEDIGTAQVADAVDQIIERTKTAYDNHHITRKPFVFVKNNSGTYGMGIMVVHSGDELRQMNRRTKNKMSVGKNKLPIDSVCVQEGVPTATLVDRLAAEPVIYLFGGQLIGGFLRTNTEKSDEDNLNSQGMVFKKLCMSDLRTPDTDPNDEELKDEPILELVYGSIARISALAAGLELAHHPKQ
jgi:glutamate--cysteine ligase